MGNSSHLSTCPRRDGTSDAHRGARLVATVFSAGVGVWQETHRTPGDLWGPRRPVGISEICGHPHTSREGTCCRLTTWSRHSSSVLGSRPTAHSRQSTSWITFSAGLWPGTEEVTVTSSSP